jgi:hypothetical protein
MCFHGFKLIVLSSFETGTLDTWEVSSKYNRWMRAMAWVHFFATVLCLAPPITSAFCFAFTAIVAILNGIRISSDRFLIHGDRLDTDVPRAKMDTLWRFVLYCGAMAGSVAILIHIPHKPGSVTK